MDPKPPVKRLDGYSELLAGFIAGGLIAILLWILPGDRVDCWLGPEVRISLFRAFATGSATVLGTTVTAVALLVSQWTAPQLDIIRRHRRRKFATLRALRSTLMMMALLGSLSVVGILIDTGNVRNLWFETVFVVVALASAGALITTIRVIYEVIDAMLYADDPPPSRPAGVAAGLAEISEAEEVHTPAETSSEPKVP